MKQDELLERLNSFEIDLSSFIQLWTEMDIAIKAASSTVSTLKNKKAKAASWSVSEQSTILLKQLGGIELYITYFDDKYYRKKLVSTLKKCFGLYVKLNPSFKSYQIENMELYAPFILFQLETEIMPIISQIKGKLELMSSDDDFILDSSSDTPFVYLKESNNKIDINKDDLIIQYLDNLHPIIIKSSKQLYLDQHYQNSIEEAIKAINQYIRDKTGIQMDGANLIDKVFSVNKPVLSFSDLSTETQRNEQVGFMEMLKGFIKGVRNIFAHNPATDIDSSVAFEYLVMASLFCKRIDQTKKDSISEP